MVRKYVNPRLSRYADITASTVDLSVYGTRAHAVVAAALGVQWESLADTAPFAHRQLVALGHTLQLIRVPDLQLEGFAIIAPIAARDTLWASLRASGAHPAGLDAFEIARIEAGRPEWGIEMDDATLAQEANMEELHAVSFTKGCYTGQETVARVHFRGHVNRHLRGLRFDEAHMLTRGSGLRDAGDKSVGDVRSAVISPRLGGVALAMVRREIEVDSEVEVVAAESTVRARVVALPFPLG